jgi:hypothetical protein
MRKYIIDDVEFYSHHEIKKSFIEKAMQKLQVFNVALLIIVMIVALAVATHYDYLIITN